MQVIHVRDEKSTGTFGDTYTGGAETVHTLNTVKANTIPGASLSSNQVVLPGGTYWIEGHTSQNQQGRLSLYDATNSAYLMHGMPSPYVGPQTGPWMPVRALIELLSPTLVELHIHPTGTLSTPPVSYGSDPEVYAELVAIRVSD